MTADIVPITTASPRLEMMLFSEPWSYHSPFGTGSDHGYKFCVYSAEQCLAVYVKTRHRMKGADPHGEWKPQRPEDHFYDEGKMDIWERRTLPAKKTDKEMLRYLKSLREPRIIGSNVGGYQLPGWAPSKPAKPKPEAVFHQPEQQQILISPRDISLLVKPIRRREDGRELFQMLYGYMQPEKK